MATLRTKDFKIGQPIELALRSIEPKQAPDNGFPGSGGMMFSTSVGAVYLDDESAREVIEEIRANDVGPGELVRLMKCKTSHGGSRFTVERVGGRDAGGHNVPDRGPRYEYDEPQRTAVAVVPQRSAATVAQPITPASAKFLAAYMVAIDTLIEAQVYAQRKGLMLTIACEDVRCLAATFVIQEGGR
jgi:hypothetical protein